MKKVFEEVQLGKLYLKNRLIRSATWEGIALPDGGVTEEAYEIYRELARGGVGAIITGFTSVALHDYYFGGMMRLCDDALIPQYQKLTMVMSGRSPGSINLTCPNAWESIAGSVPITRIRSTAF